MRGYLEAFFLTICHRALSRRSNFGPQMLLLDLSDLAEPLDRFLVLS